MFHQHKYICSVKLRVVHNTCMFNKEALKNTMSISVVIRTSSNLASLDNMDIMSSDLRALKLIGLAPCIHPCWTVDYHQTCMLSLSPDRGLPLGLDRWQVVSGHPVSQYYQFTLVTLYPCWLSSDRGSPCMLSPSLDRLTETTIKARLSPLITVEINTICGATTNKNLICVFWILNRFGLLDTRRREDIYIWVE